MNGTWWVDPGQLDDDQMDVVKLGRDGNFLILGPPGCGKTNLLVLRANYLSAADRPDIIILVSTRTLREFLASGAINYQFPADKIQTHNEWAKRLLRENGVQLETSEDYKTEMRSLFTQIKELIEEKKIYELYDAIFLDEAHDFTKEEIDIFFRLGKNVFAVADSRQKIYDNEDPIEYIKSQVDETKDLKFHYRNGLDICRLADEITKATQIYNSLEDTSNYDESAFPSTVQHRRCVSLTEQCEKALVSLETQLEAYPNEMIGVICPRRLDLPEIRSFFSTSSISTRCVFQDPEEGYSRFDPEKPICVCTLHGAKGLEFRALHILVSCQA